MLGEWWLYDTQTLEKVLVCDNAGYYIDVSKDFDAVFMCGVPSDYRNEILKYCIANDIACFIKPKISDTIIRGGKTIQMMNVPVYRCKRGDAGFIYLAAKRFFDVVLSLIAILISSPFMFVTAAAIKLYDGGKADATGKFIYAPKGDELFPETGGKVEIGKTYHVRIDLKEYMKAAFDLAQSKGALAQSEWENMAVNGFNIGWEVSNLAKVGVKIENMSLRVVEYEK